jgi:hypothetical protein
MMDLQVGNFARNLGETTQLNRFFYQSFFANMRLIGPIMGRGLFGKGSSSGLTGGGRHGSCKKQALLYPGAFRTQSVCNWLGREKA